MAISTKLKVESRWRGSFTSVPSTMNKRSCKAKFVVCIFSLNESMPLPKSLNF